MPLITRKIQTWIKKGCGIRIRMQVCPMTNPASFLLLLTTASHPCPPLTPLCILFLFKKQVKRVKCAPSTFPNIFNVLTRLSLTSCCDEGTVHIVILQRRKRRYGKIGELAQGSTAVSSETGIFLQAAQLWRPCPSLIC